MLRAERSTASETSPVFCGGRKINEMEQAWLWSELQADGAWPSRLVMDRVAVRQAPLSIGVRQVNRWRVRWQCARPKGRPRKVVVAATASALATVSPLTYVGVHVW